MFREIIIWPDPRLKQVAQPVTDVQAPEVQALIADMIQTCLLAKGLGLAAPQVGVALRIIVVDESAEQQGTRLAAVVNPVIEQYAGAQTLTEGCLSVPGYSNEVSRAQSVVVTGLTAAGTPVRYEATDLAAAAFQHEVDHLDGRLYLDLLSPLKRDIARQKMKRIKRDISDSRSKVSAWRKTQVTPRSSGDGL